MVCYGNMHSQSSLVNMKKNLDDVLTLIQKNYSDPVPDLETLRKNSLIFDDSLIRWSSKD